MRIRHARGFTIVELLVVISMITLLVAILLPAIGKARDAALTTQSLAHLRNLATAHGAYSADWSDRQWTAVPDDVGLYSSGSAHVCQDYISGGGCPPPMILGSDANDIWGWFLPCGEVQGTCANWHWYRPMVFELYIWGNAGWFQLINCRSFNSYLNGRFYDPVFYAPKDVSVLVGAEKGFALPYDYTHILPDGVYLSSYIGSPAALWAPDVLSKNPSTQKYYTNPDTMPGGYRSPAAGQATYPDLKTRMLEHHWLQHKPGSDFNYNFTVQNTAWFFNHGYNSSPATMFYDGHVQVVGCDEAMEADGRAMAAPGSDGSGLWSRDTPLGANGFYIAQSYDFVVDTSFHILTIDGIRGRDVLK